MTLHEATKQALGLAKVRFRNTPETLKAFTGLQAKKTSLATTRRNTYSDLNAWYAAATRVFPLGTETGALARAQIPT